MNRGYLRYVELMGPFASFIGLGSLPPPVWSDLGSALRQYATFFVCPKW
jgi:hypothetical protein